MRERRGDESSERPPRPEKPKRYSDQQRKAQRHANERERDRGRIEAGLRQVDAGIDVATERAVADELPEEVAVALALVPVISSELSWATERRRIDPRGCIAGPDHVEDDVDQ